MNDRLEQRVEQFLRTGEGDFEAQALELFNYQFQKNLAYQFFCKSQGRTPASVLDWKDIPAVPIAAFKSSELVTFPSGQAAAVFHSSGTTLKVPSRHFLRTLSYYEAALTYGFSHAVLPDQAALPFFILALSPGEAPRSSLSWMLDVVRRRWGAPGSTYFLRRGMVEDGRLARVLIDAERIGHPVALLGTTLAFLTFLDRCAEKKLTLRCAPGSRIMDTGGMKTQTREVSRTEFLHRVWTHLGIPEAQCINEYGMCELSSQFYGRGASMLFQGPPWVRTQVVNPETGLPAAEGETGLLKHLDLANVDSVMAVLTEDLGEARSDGFILKGRAPAADLKGCSVDMERYFQRS